MYVFILESLDKDRLKQYLGVFFFFILLARFLYRPGGERHEPPAVWKYLAFSFSGLMQGMLAMGGPPLVLWLLARPGSAREARALLLSIFLLSAPYQLGLLYYFSGQDAREAFLMALSAVLAPLSAIGSFIGVRIGNRFTRKTLDRWVMLLLLLMILSCLFAPYL